ncbi:MAG: ATP-binding protein [Polyangiaceae bacterium]|nr:ATP-binding protein [Polyangiaceae bacterium]
MGLWLLRMLVRGGLLRRFWANGDWPSREIGAALGIPKRVVHSGRSAGFAGELAALGAWLEDVERGPLDTEPRERNVRWLGERLALSPAECDVLGFLACLDAEDALQHALGAAAGREHARLHLMAHALGLSVRELRPMLRQGGALMRTRLVQAYARPYQPTLPFSLMDGLDEILAAEYPSPEALLGHFFRQAPPPAHTLGDYPHLAASAQVAVRLLAGATAQRTVGVNVLLYGPPGTGKTQLARTLARAAGAALHEVVVENARGDTLGHDGRIAAYVLCQRMLADAPGVVVVFDEAEDAFPHLYPLLKQRGAECGKGFMNQVLETNPAPTLWIANSVEHIDSAHLRRFDLAIEVGAPPTHVRRTILDSALGHLGVGSEWLSRHADDERLRPAHVARAARVAAIIGATAGADAERAVERVLESALRVERAHAPRRSAGHDACAYDLAYVNASVDAQRLIEGLARSGRGTLCLHGPPGTGKSALVSHMASCLGVPLHISRASDLLSMWLGGTEANIAAAFARARDEGALLFIDEADGFLRERALATRSWEVTGVNELLVHMETFDGILACATNSLETLDAASLRRFAVKVRFEPLRPDQRKRLLLATLAARGAVSRVKPRDLAALDRLSALTPGDFAAVARRVDILAEPLTPSRFIAELAEEHRLKPGQGARAIGFAVSG